MECRPGNDSLEIEFAMGLELLLAGLSDLRAYPDSSRAVEVRQTHISIVCLTGEFAYKIRKPVRFSFLDFSSLQLRRADCEREVELNQRLAPDVYLGIVPIVVVDGRIKVEGDGEVVEWAVKMRRLPDDATLEHGLLQDEIGSDTIAMLGRRLASFHESASSGPHIAEFGRYDAVSGNVLDNLEIGRMHGGTVVDQTLMERLTALTSQRLRADRDLIERRAARGIPRDTHGDLRADHVYLFPARQPPGDLCVIDCIEFNDTFRYADPIADIAFLIMDLKYHGRPDLASQLADEYFTASGDEEGRNLLPLYVSYRAAVRAKVETLKSVEAEIPEIDRLAAAEQARGHWRLALSELEDPSRRPCLILVGGLPGTGKTTLARGLAETGGFSIIRTDVVRKELAGIPEHASAGAVFQSGIYSDAWTDRTYDECLRRAVELLQSGQRVVVDGTFSRERHRRQFLDAARRLALHGLFMQCRSDPQVIRRRLDERIGDASDANWDVYKSAAEKWEPVGKQTARVTNIIDSGLSAQFARMSAFNILRNAELLEPEYTETIRS